MAVSMAGTNPLWGAPRVHGELLKLGLDVSQATVAKYMVRGTKPPSQTWRTFLANHNFNGANTSHFSVATGCLTALLLGVILICIIEVVRCR